MQGLSLVSKSHFAIVVKCFGLNRMGQPQDTRNTIKLRPSFHKTFVSFVKFVAKQPKTLRRIVP